MLVVTAGDPQFSEAEISHCLALFFFYQTKLNYKTKTDPFMPLKLIFLKNSNCTTFLEGHRRLLCHWKS